MVCHRVPIRSYSAYECTLQKLLLPHLKKKATATGVIISPWIKNISDNAIGFFPVFLYLATGFHRVQ